MSFNRRPISSLCQHPSNPSIFLSGGEKHGIVCWDMRTNKVVREYIGVFGEIQDMCFLDVEVISLSDD